MVSVLFLFVFLFMVHTTLQTKIMYTQFNFRTRQTSYLENKDKVCEGSEEVVLMLTGL